MARLTKTRVDAFKCRTGAQQDFLWCGEQRGFGLRCTAAGKKTFILRGRVKGTGAERFIRIGAYGKLSFDKAETKARKLLLQLDQGVDPRVETTKMDALKVTLREVAQEYVATKRTKNGPLRATTKADILRHVDKNLADWADNAISTITRRPSRRSLLSGAGPKRTPASSSTSGASSRVWLAGSPQQRDPRVEHQHPRAARVFSSWSQTMKKAKKAIVIHTRVMTLEETKAAEEELAGYIAERMALLKKHGYTSGEGFYVDKDGVPRSISEDD